MSKQDDKIVNKLNEISEKLDPDNTVRWERKLQQDA
jgi:hypothetical protein